MKVHVRPSAREDMLEAALFYEKQEPGLGDRVIGFLEREVMNLGSAAILHRKSGRFHCAIVGGDFPYYVIYYTIENEGIQVWAVLDHRRDPQTIRRRLRQV